MRKLLILAALAFGLLAGGAAFSAPNNGDELLKDEKHFLQQSNKTFKGGQKAGSAVNMTVLGHTDLGGRGFNADVWVHKGFAYVGHWGFRDWATGNDRFCPEQPESGVAVVDVDDPSDPQQVATL